MDANSQARLEAGLISGNQRFIMLRDGEDDNEDLTLFPQPVVADLEAMEQTNVQTGRVRRIKRVISKNALRVCQRCGAVILLVCLVAFGGILYGLGFNVYGSEGPAASTPSSTVDGRLSASDPPLGSSSGVSNWSRPSGMASSLSSDRSWQAPTTGLVALLEDGRVPITDRSPRSEATMRTGSTVTSSAMAALPDGPWPVGQWDQHTGVDSDTRVVNFRPRTPEGFGFQWALRHPHYARERQPPAANLEFYCVKCAAPSEALLCRGCATAPRVFNGEPPFAYCLYCGERARVPFRFCTFCQESPAWHHGRCCRGYHE